MKKEFKDSINKHVVKGIKGLYKDSINKHVVKGIKGL